MMSKNFHLILKVGNFATFVNCGIDSKFWWNVGFLFSSILNNMDKCQHKSLCFSQKEENWGKVENRDNKILTTNHWTFYDNVNGAIECKLRTYLWKSMVEMFKCAKLTNHVLYWRFPQITSNVVDPRQDQDRFSTIDTLE